MSDPLTWKLGGVQITRVEESVASMPLDTLIPEATREQLERHAAWLRPHFLEADGNILLSVHALIVESEGRRILVDTCVGDREIPGFEALTAESNTFLEDLAAAGYPRESIDTVLCTHLHFDHVGWNTMRDGDRWVPTFPNARYLFARKEWEHWSQEEKPVFAATLSDAVRPIVDLGLADLVETDHRLTGEVRLEATPGHTPGHVAVRIDSGRESALITGDLTHHPVQWAEPAWQMMADSDSDEAARTRSRLIAEHAGAGTLIIGTHYAPPCAGHLEQAEPGAARFLTKR